VSGSPAYRAVSELERRAAAQLAAIHWTIVRLARKRNEIIARNARARKALFEQRFGSAFACTALSSHTIWTANAAAECAATQRAQMLDVARIAGERLHWARCRRGLERRAAKRTENG